MGNSVLSVNYLINIYYGSFKIKLMATLSAVTTLPVIYSTWRMCLSRILGRSNCCGSTHTHFLLKLLFLLMLLSVHCQIFSVTTLAFQKLTKIWSSTALRPVWRWKSMGTDVCVESQTSSDVCAGLGSKVKRFFVGSKRSKIPLVSIHILHKLKFVAFSWIWPFFVLKVSIRGSLDAKGLQAINQTACIAWLFSYISIYSRCFSISVTIHRLRMGFSCAPTKWGLSLVSCTWRMKARRTVGLAEERYIGLTKPRQYSCGACVCYLFLLYQRLHLSFSFMSKNSSFHCKERTSLVEAPSSSALQRPQNQVWILKVTKVTLFLKYDRRYNIRTLLVLLFIEKIMRSLFLLTSDDENTKLCTASSNAYHQATFCCVLGRFGQPYISYCLFPRRQWKALRPTLNLDRSSCTWAKLCKVVSLYASQ